MIECVGSRLMKKDTFIRKALEYRLAIALIYAASGDLYDSMSYNFCVANNSICCIIPETRKTVNQEYLEEITTCPSTSDEWKQVTKGFSERRNFCNTCGDIDGKHVAIKCSPNGGSISGHSIQLYLRHWLTQTTAFTRQFGSKTSGSDSNGGVFNVCSLREALEGEFTGLLEPEPLPQGDKKVPSAMVGDDAFALRT